VSGADLKVDSDNVNGNCKHIDAGNRKTRLGESIEAGVKPSWPLVPLDIVLLNNRGACLCNGYQVFPAPFQIIICSCVKS